MTVLAAAEAAAAASVLVPPGFHVGIDHGFAGAKNPPGGPAFPFADLCTGWKFKYLVDGGELSLWTQCPTQDASGAKVLVNALLPLESSLIANALGIKPAYPSNSAPVSFSSVCQACTLPDPKGTVMACSCTTNGGHPLLAINLTKWITANQGVPCFTDGVVCGTIQMTLTTPTTPTTLAFSASSATTVAKETQCTET
ncbi:hypothetical protein SCUCBS95973_004070 [Sporothrix curviconia]|uniref:Uncharacterized protein n=1 Tax=Sporothrix curviconia TaxID=1260050 RepID=A0ABP0BKM0_9PEZI